MKIVIPSKGRAGILYERAFKLFPEALVCVGESDVADYSKVTKNLLVHPDDVTGIGPLRQWILDNVEDEIVVQVDDDVHSLYSLTGFSKKTLDTPRIAARVIATTALCAQDSGARVFGFNQTWDVRKFMPFKPFLLNSWTGGVIGVIGKSLRFDTFLKLRADIDFCLQSLMKDRFVWIENRYSFVHKRWAGSGGNASNRSEARHKEEIEYLQRKWGKYLKVQDTKTTTRLVMQVPR